MKSLSIIPAVILGVASFAISTSAMADYTTTRTTTTYSDPLGGLIRGTGQVLNGIGNAGGSVVRGAARGTNEVVRGTVHGTKTAVNGVTRTRTTTTVHHYKHYKKYQ